MNPAAKQRFWAVIPAAGSGSRFGAAQPKQYLPLRDRPLVEHTLAPFLTCGWIDGVVVVLAANDLQFSALQLAAHWKLHRATGGATRAQSVLAGLSKVQQLAQADAAVSVLVHDAARPCITIQDLERLRDECDEGQGALLALPVTDTVKRAEAGSAAQTVDRRELWRAQTPQMFRLDLLQPVLERAVKEGQDITDEAGAMENAGYRPRLVLGRESNLKVTMSSDLALAEFWLKKQENAA